MAQHGRRRRGRGGREGRQWLLIEGVHQDRLDRGVAVLADGVGAGARGLQAGDAKALGEAEDALGAAEAIEGAVAEQGVDDGETGGADLGGALATPGRRLQEEVDLVRRQMVRERAALARAGAADLHRRFDDLKADMAARFSRIDQRFDDLRSDMNWRLNDMNQKLGTFMWVVSGWFVFLSAVLAVFGFLRR